MSKQRHPADIACSSPGLTRHPGQLLTLPPVVILSLKVEQTLPTLLFLLRHYQAVEKAPTASAVEIRQMEDRGSESPLGNSSLHFVCGAACGDIFRGFPL